MVRRDESRARIIASVISTVAAIVTVNVAAMMSSAAYRVKVPMLLPVDASQDELVALQLDMLQDEVMALQQDIQLIYHSIIWLSRLMFTIAIGVLGLAVSNFIKKPKRQEEREEQ